MLPYSYQAIFKGILGECVIKELFSFFGIELKSFKEMVNRGIVEVFDDISINDMYIDYKNYNLDKINHREFLNDSIKEKLEYKRSLINKENKLFIINLIDKNSESKLDDLLDLFFEDEAKKLELKNKYKEKKRIQEGYEKKEEIELLFLCLLEIEKKKINYIG